MLQKIVKAIQFKSKYYRLNFIEKAHNLFVVSKASNDFKSDLKEWNEITAHATKRSDINEHLSTLFSEGITIHPKLVVELGVRTGESTFVFEKVAKFCDSVLISVDLDPCIRFSSWTKWWFVQQDDIPFAKEFPNFCKEKNINTKIDLLFIDTSHLYEHSLAEIASWFPLLADKCKVIFHDTNMQEVFHRNDKSIGLGWNNNRGVIRAIEEYFNTSFDETKNFKTIINGFLITHYSNCSGLTILERINNPLLIH